MEERFEKALEFLKMRNQEHVLAWWAELDSETKSRLLAQIEAIPWDLLDPIFPNLAKGPDSGVSGGIEPATVFPRRPGPAQKDLYERAERTGRMLLERGVVAAFTVAGGQATRLGIDAPKGTVVVTPVGDRSLFQLFAEMVAAVRERYGSSIPWYIMTSEANHAATREYFDHNHNFDLPRDDVRFFKQGMLPAFTPDGKLILDHKHSLAQAPDGHGGSLKALVQSGAISDMRRRGIEVISYFQVDNPLVKPFDPLFLGLHQETGSEMSTKVARKADDLERVGNVCMRDGRIVVVEYSEFPESLARARNADGARKFDAANLAIHALNVEFVARVAGESFQLPLRRADKIVPYVDERGERITPARPNAVKFEAFIFDALPLAGRPLLLEADRAEEFSPVKNATGIDSLETSKRDQIRRAARWLEEAGVLVPIRADGEPDVTIAISPRFALDASDLRGKSDRLPRLVPSAPAYIE